MKKRFSMVMNLLLAFGMSVVMFLCIDVPTIEDVEPSTESSELVTVEPPPPIVLEEEETYINADELELLAHVIFAEAGSDWCEDEMLYGVGSVVLNRMASEYFPDTMYEVVYQEGQYACTWDGNIEKEPNERAYRIAEDLLRNGSTLPPNVIFQAEFEQGDGIYLKVQNMYFCYINEKENNNE